MDTTTRPFPVQTVLGPISYEEMGITDAHNHVWIDRVPGADPDAPVLDDFEAIRAELESFRAEGGSSLLDCQPGGCGRNGNRLIELARASGVQIVACTGFHRRRYYAPGFWLFSAGEHAAAEYFSAELAGGLAEILPQPAAARAGFIKIALEASWADTPRALLEGSAAAARNSGALIEIHTEKGALAERVTLFFEQRGVAPTRLVLCHMDKRPDFILHSELARMGVQLEYDTFYRPKYDPEIHLWPLIGKMVAAGLDDHIVLATDMAEASLYRKIGGGPGLMSLPGQLRRRLAETGIAEDAIRRMLGGNIARRLAGLP